MLETERSVYLARSSKEAQLKESAPSRADLLEGFAGAAVTTLRAPLFGLTAIQPADLDYGWDLGSRSGRAAWLHAQREGKPLLTILGFPCTPWCIFNRNINFEGSTAGAPGHPG